MRRSLLLSAAMAVVALSAAGERANAAEPGVKDRWSTAIGKFEADDRAKPFEPNGIVFVGSSSIRLWDLADSFPTKTLLNRGFGGSQLADSVEYADQLVIKHRPRLVFLYAGDNDVAAGKSPETIREDFRAFAAKVYAKLPDTRIVYLAIKPSVARRDKLALQQQANQLIAAEAAADKRLVFLDVATPLLDAQGEPRPEMFVKDRLHLSKEGYAVWNRLVAPLLE